MFASSSLPLVMSRLVRTTQHPSKRTAGSLLSLKTLTETGEATRKGKGRKNGFRKQIRQDCVREGGRQFKIDIRRLVERERDGNRGTYTDKQTEGDREGYRPCKGPKANLLKHTDINSTPALHCSCSPCTGAVEEEHTAVEWNSTWCP